MGWQSWVQAVVIAIFVRSGGGFNPFGSAGVKPVPRNRPPGGFPFGVKARSPGMPPK